MRLILCGLIAFASTVSAQNWPAYRGVGAKGVGERAVPVAWDVNNQQNIAWKTAIPGLGLSSPIIWGNTIYVTTAVSSQGESKMVMKNDGVIMADDQVLHTWRVLAIDRRSGKVLWDQVAHEGVPSAKRHVKSSFANATPVTDGKHVVVLMASEALVAFDMKGKQLWKRAIEPNTGGAILDQSSSPVIYGKSVILQDDRRRGSYIAAFDIATGKDLWRTQRNEGMSWSTPTIVRGTINGKPQNVLVTQSGRFVRGIDPATGKELWQMAQNDPEPWDRIPAPIETNDSVIILGGNPARPVFAIRKTAMGDITLQKDQTSNQHVAWTSTRGGAYMPSPIVIGDKLFTVRENGVLSALRAATGELLYQQRLGNGGYFSPSPVAAGGLLYIANDDGEVFVVRAGDKFELVKQNHMGEMCFATPALAGNMLVVRTQKHLYGISERR